LGWGGGQLPYLLPGVTVEDASATPQVLNATVIALVIAAVIVASALCLLHKST
jgi:cytochrome d ubiquinol oxidase subunit II